MCATLWTSNLVGLTCARSLHYQFYAWYAHQIPWLLWAGAYGRWGLLRLVALVLLEIGWNTFPSTPASSAGLLCAHVVILYGLGRRRSVAYVATA